MTKEDWKWLGMRLRDIRQQRKISLKELSELTGISDSHLSNIESDKSHPCLAGIVAIVQALDVSLDYIVRGICPLHNTGGLVFHSNDELENIFLLTEE